MGPAWALLLQHQSNLGCCFTWWAPVTPNEATSRNSSLSWCILSSSCFFKNWALTWFAKMNCAQQSSSWWASWASCPLFFSKRTAGHKNELEVKPEQRGDGVLVIQGLVFETRAAETSLNAPPPWHLSTPAPWYSAEAKGLRAPWSEVPKVQQRLLFQNAPF